MEPEDLDLLYHIENDTKLWDVGATNVPYSRYVLHDYIASNQYDIYADRQVRFMVENEAHEVVGILDLINFEPRHQRAEVGIVVLNRFRRRGYGKAALEECMTYASCILHLHQLYAYIDASNEASLQLFSSLGFSRGAVLKQWLSQGHEYHDAIVVQYLF